MEGKCKMLFDFQYFQQNSHLAQLIAETEDRYGKALNDDDLSFVNAAGDLTPWQPPGKDVSNVDI